MKKIICSFLATTALTLAASAYAADESASTQSSMDYKKNGGYDATVKTSGTDTAGTYTSTKTNADVSVDDSGKTSKTLTSDSTVDPKGLRNKKTHHGKLTYKDKKNGGYSKSVVSDNRDAAGTNRYVKKTKDVNVDNSGNVTATTTTDKITDPPGLMNKTEEKTKTKTVNGVVTEDSTTSR